MSNEKIMILKMLEDGKISATEAARLLESVGGESAPQADNIPIPNSSGHSSYRASEPQSAPIPPSPPNQKRTTEDVKNWASDFGRKVEVIAKDFEPKLQKLTEVVAEKTVMFADKISKTLASPPTPDERPRPAPPQPPAPSRTMSAPAAPSTITGNQAAFELTVVPSELNELNLTAVNGSVFIKGYNGDKITAKVLFSSKHPSADLKLMRLGSTYYLNYDQDLYNSISIEAYIPSTMFRKIHLETCNSKLSLEGASASDIVLYNQNGEISASSIRAATISAETNGAKMTLNGITAQQGTFEDYNGAIEAMSLDIEKLKLEAANAPVNIIITSISQYSDYAWKIQTSNNKLKINLPTSTDVGYDINAYTSLSDISVGLSSLVYSINEKNNIQAKTANYQSASKKVRLELDTSGANLSIN